MFEFNNNGLPDSELSTSSGIDLSTDFLSGGRETKDRIGKKKIAQCRTDGCPSRPAKTIVGGCDVCLQYCQPIYDAGKDPKDLYVPDTSNVSEKGKSLTDRVMGEAQAIVRAAAKDITERGIAIAR